MATQILGIAGHAAATGLQIGTLYGTGATNVLMGAGGAVSYRKPLQQRKEEIDRLQAIFTRIQNFFRDPDVEERGDIIASFAGSDVQITPDPRESSFTKEHSFAPSAASFLAQNEHDGSIGPKQWIESLKRGKKILSQKELESMSSLDKAKYCMTLHLYGELVRKRLDTEKTLLSIDQANRASFATQALSGAGQIAVATAEIGQAGVAVMNAASGFSLLSSIFFLGASLRGIYAFSRDLLKNRAALKELEDRKKALEQNKDKGSVEKAFCESEIARLNEASEALKIEKAFLKQTLNYHIINALAGLLGLAATILFIYGTQGLGLIGIVAYYSLVGASSALPIIAMIYKARSTNETSYLEKLANLYNHHSHAPLPDLSAITDVNWIKDQLKTAIMPIGTKSKRDDEQLNDILKQFEDLHLGRTDILSFLKELYEITVDEEISSIRFANGIQELYRPA